MDHDGQRHKSPRPSVLDTFQTYHAIFRSVNPPAPNSVAESLALNLARGEGIRAIHGAPVAPFHLNGAQAGALNLIKELVLEVPRSR